MKASIAVAFSVALLACIAWELVSEPLQCQTLSQLYEITPEEKQQLVQEANQQFEIVTSSVDCSVTGWGPRVIVIHEGGGTVALDLLEQLEARLAQADQKHPLQGQPLWRLFDMCMGSGDGALICAGLVYRHLNATGLRTLLRQAPHRSLWRLAVQKFLQIPAMASLVSRVRGHGSPQRGCHVGLSPLAGVSFPKLAVTLMGESWVTPTQPLSVSSVERRHLGLLSPALPADAQKKQKSPVLAHSVFPFAFEVVDIILEIGEPTGNRSWPQHLQWLLSQLEQAAQRRQREQSPEIHFRLQSHVQTAIEAETVDAILWLIDNTAASRAYIPKLDASRAWLTPSPLNDNVLSTSVPLGALASDNEISRALYDKPSWDRLVGRCIGLRRFAQAPVRAYVKPTPINDLDDSETWHLPKPSPPKEIRRPRHPSEVTLDSVFAGDVSVLLGTDFTEIGLRQVPFADGQWQIHANVADVVAMAQCMLGTWVDPTHGPNVEYTQEELRTKFESVSPLIVALLTDFQVASVRLEAETSPPVLTIKNDSSVQIQFFWIITVLSEDIPMELLVESVFVAAVSLPKKQHSLQATVHLQHIGTVIDVPPAMMMMHGQLELLFQELSDTVSNIVATQIAQYFPVHASVVDWLVTDKQMRRDVAKRFELRQLKFTASPTGPVCGSTERPKPIIVSLVLARA